MLSLQDQGLFSEIFYILCGLSVLGELFIVISYMSIRRKNNTMYNQVIWLFATDICSLGANFYSLKSNLSGDMGCKVFGFIHEISHICSICWTSIIAGTIFYSIRTQQKIASLSTKYVLLICSISCLFSIYPIISGGYGLYDGFNFPICWLTDNESFSTIIIAYWIPVGASFIFNVICYTGIIIYLKRKYSTDVFKDFTILFVFPLVQMIANSGFLIYSLQIINGGQLTAAIQLVHVITRGGEGMFNVIAYGLSYSVRKDIYKVWCLRRREKSRNYSDLTAESESPFASLNY